VGFVAIKAGGDPTVHFEFAKTAFNEIALAIKFLVVPVWVFAHMLAGILASGCREVTDYVLRKASACPALFLHNCASR